MQQLSGQGLPRPLDYIVQLTSGSTYPATFGASGNASTNWRYPTWMQVIGAGTVVIINEDGSSSTLICAGGEVFEGTFLAVTSSSATRLNLGVGRAPRPSAALAVGDLYSTLRTTQGIIELPASSFYLATGAPLAIFANGASAVPGASLTDSEAFCVRWNDHATPNAVTRGFHMPPDADITQNMIAHVKASKTGATVGDATTFDIALFNNPAGALHDDDVNFGGTTSAMVGDATAKTVQDITRAIAAANLAAHPNSVTITVKPTAGTLGTDDLCMLEVYILYTKKLLTT